MGELCACTASERVRLYSVFPAEWSDVLHRRRERLSEMVTAPPALLETEA
jgi:hypothetical protein